MSERAIQTGIVRALEARGCLVVKMHGSPYMPAGLPDLLVMRGGRAAWVEVKTPDGRLTPVQRAMAARLRRAGTPVITARSVADLEELRELWN